MRKIRTVVAGIDKVKGGVKNTFVRLPVTGYANQFVPDVSGVLWRGIL